MRQTQLNVKSACFQIFLFCFLYSASLLGKNNKVVLEVNFISDTISVLSKANTLFNQRKYDKAISEYKALLDNNYRDSTYLYKRLAFSYAKSNQPNMASVFIEKYILKTLDVSFVNHSYFDPIKKNDSFKILQKKYQRKINVWALFCLYVGFIGVFISTILIFKPAKDRIANLLIGCFLLLHSFFILRISILITNYEFYLPHSLYVSASFSFLYGPFIYFYFKRIDQEYQLKKGDIIHLLPTVLFLVFMIPIYSLSGDEKLYMIVHNARPYTILIMLAKLVSLIIYGSLLMVKYLGKIKLDETFNRSEKNWRRNLIVFYSLYTMFYGTYAFVFRKYELGSLLFNLQIFLMTLLVLYVSYNTFFNLALVRDKKWKTVSIDKLDAYKYSSSSLTSELSIELKDKLVDLMDERKVYRDNDITLQKIADLLNTNRHNTSQIINEHFGLNFFDLINSYRINEAMSILKNNKSGVVNIIDVAYEVGFNNKVTFNKSFKKYNQITPSEYLRSFSI
ncbi:Helix-turn-helix domain-containing protein [Aquimarina amphilecti]|uniref:Helix-turn-helix domain-containing protein n=1 Tax=Aquimarina amphilecti TaxID=1038014 RepID=A0A1H7PTX6_AQUAM|nr:helix-turn-helix transcriptional regulator [Aquimarina amphilecti]SEL38918.1 Helix-turn-helix domain-containing protein [Aquimarina amphilecti]